MSYAVTAWLSRLTGSPALTLMELIEGIGGRSGSGMLIIA
jgi:hypothetical protein